MNAQELKTKLQACSKEEHRVIVNIIVEYALDKTMSDAQLTNKVKKYLAGASK